MAETTTPVIPDQDAVLRRMRELAAEQKFLKRQLKLSRQFADLMAEQEKFQGGDGVPMLNPDRGLVENFMPDPVGIGADAVAMENGQCG